MSQLHTNWHSSYLGKSRKDTIRSNEIQSGVYLGDDDIVRLSDKLVVLRINNYMNITNDVIKNSELHLVQVVLVD